MPVHNESVNLPQFYSTACHFGVPCKARDKVNEEQKHFNHSRVPLQGTLCLSKNVNATPCIFVNKQKLAAFEDPLRNLQPGISVLMVTEALAQITQGQQTGSGTGSNGSATVNVTTYLMTMNLVIPNISRANNNASYNGSKPIHFCPNVFSEYPPNFLDCRGRQDKIISVSPGFWFTPELKRV